MRRPSAFLCLSLLMLLLSSLPAVPGRCAPAPDLEEEIGQLLMVGFRGLAAEGAAPVLRDIRDYNLGGVILFDRDLALDSMQRNIDSPGQVRALTEALQKEARAPLLIAVDQEGGKVSRLRPDLGFLPSPAPAEMGARDQVEETYAQARLLARQLREVGINLNLAPVVDLAVNPDNFIARVGRTYAASPQAVVRHARAFIRAHRDEQMLCALKHFPGHGSARADTHKGMVDVTATWNAPELTPFAELAPESELVMTAHIFQRDLDPRWPATLSPPIIDGLLRQRLGFAGVVISDDLTMGAIADHYGYDTALEQALNAGVDILLIANNKTYDADIVPRTVQIIGRLVAEGRVPRERIDAAYNRILRLKKRLEDTP